MQPVARPLTLCQADGRSFFKQAIKTKQQKAGRGGGGTDDDDAEGGCILCIFRAPSRTFLSLPCLSLLGAKGVCPPHPVSPLEDLCITSAKTQWARQRLVILEDTALLGSRGDRILS